ncbi:hypothetical protein ASG12_09285 [Williamsia sp. Leaf354]|uniref:hypothetical protein n=1 Tax=Williamsia sp. Leaf354 TaxID=1736349 RepID=UPI0006FFE98B|nr:hypothetical protein [Williamsia sp. Leaf354]KQR98607.1 hypothetical protein ASG12_09285 [Williamsia sp. Leaf354]
MISTRFGSHGLRTLIATSVIATGAITGAAGVATAAPAAPAINTGAVAYSPTLTVTPGFACFAVINATKLPQTKAGQYRVKVQISRFGANCGAFKLAVTWRNLTNGNSDGQIQTVRPDGSVEGFPDNILDGFGFGPGAGRVASTITTYSKYDESGETTLPNLPGKATFSLY